MTKIVLCTGGFDPLHSGHISYFEAAKRLGDHLVVGVNSDSWLARKRGKGFMPFSERAAIVSALRCVDRVISFDDSDDSACDAILKIRQARPDAEILFANGGDRARHNTPEMEISDPHLQFVFGIGGSDKRNSSSWILDSWEGIRTKRNWGWYRVLANNPASGYKVKELVIEPGQSLSFQRHQHRSEHWYTLSGSCTLKTLYLGRTQHHSLEPLSQGFVIERGVWHQATNTSDLPCRVLEVQYGEQCVEEDIERWKD